MTINALAEHCRRQNIKRLVEFVSTHLRAELGPLCPKHDEDIAIVALDRGYRVVQSMGLEYGPGYPKQPWDIKLTSATVMYRRDGSIVATL